LKIWLALLSVDWKMKSQRNLVPSVDIQQVNSTGRENSIAIEWHHD